MARTPHRWDPNCPPPKGLVRPVRIDPAGRTGPTRGQARGPKWRSTSHAYHVPARVDGTLPEQRIMEQSVRLPHGGAVTGWASLRLASATFFDGLQPDGRTLIPVPLAIGPNASIRIDAAITVSRDRLDPSEVQTRQGIPCTNEVRGLFDAVRTAVGLREGVVAIDMAAAAMLVSVRQLRAYAADHPGWNGVPQVRAAADLASERSKSPNETRMRLIWVIDAGLPAPLVNQPIWDLRGRLLGIADLLDPEAGVVGEYDGAEHRKAIRQSQDVAREDAFRGHGLECFRVTGPDMGHTMRIVRRMHSARARARWSRERDRRWTVTPPPGWGRDETLDEYLAERAWRHELYARYEREDRAHGTGPPQL